MYKHMNVDNHKKLINAAKGIDDEGLELRIQSNHRTVGSNTSMVSSGDSQQCLATPASQVTERNIRVET
jgi:hypothetical protein